MPPSPRDSDRVDAALRFLMEITLVAVEPPTDRAPECVSASTTTNVVEAT